MLGNRAEAVALGGELEDATHDRGLCIVDRPFDV
jgi:hypothetical protein